MVGRMFCHPPVFYALCSLSTVFNPYCRPRKWVAKFVFKEVTQNDPNTNLQIIVALADFTSLNEEEGLPLILHLDFILTIHSDIDEGEREIRWRGISGRCRGSLLHREEGYSVPHFSTG